MAATPSAPPTAIVTGASGAFGSATCTALRERGYHVAGIDRTPSEGVITADVTDADQVTRAVDVAVQQLGGGLDRLIHFAGIGPAIDVGRAPDADVRETLEVNLLGAWRVTAASLQPLLAARGRVVVASLLAGLTVPFAGAYTVSKRALTAYADTLRIEYGTHLGVTTVYPGYVDTPIHDRSRAAGVALDGTVPAEQVRDTVSAVVKAATLRRPRRDMASSRLGSLILGTTRHVPGLLERAVGYRIGRLLRGGAFAESDLAAGLRARHEVIEEPWRRTT